MTKTIWKYQVPLDLKPVMMPEGAEILSVHEQGGEICLWALVDPKAEEVQRVFSVIGTGWDTTIPDISDFIGTAHLQGGSLVFHVFEVK